MYHCAEYLLKVFSVGFLFHKITDIYRFIIMKICIIWYVIKKTSRPGAEPQPKITCLFCVHQDASNLYLAMEFHAGGDLLSLMQRMGNRLEETAVRFYTAEVRINFFLSC